MDTESSILKIILRTLIIKMKLSPYTIHLRALMIAVIGLLKVKDSIREEFLRLLADKSPDMMYLG